MDFQSLPGKLLCRIFSELPPIMLLDVIPLVCKRWYGLSKRPDCWKNLNLIIDDEASKENLEDLVRLARAAPYLNHIDFIKVKHLNPQVKSIIFGLLHEPKTVKTLSTFGSTSVQMRALIRKMLQQWSASLREVTIQLPCPTSENKDYLSSIGTIFTRVSEIPQLKSLCIVLFSAQNLSTTYSGQLGKGCPSLKRFVVRSMEHGCLPAKCSSFVFDILEKKKDQLLEVDITEVCEPTYKYRAVLGACHNLISCKVPLEILPVVKDMRELRSLEVYFMAADERRIAKSFKEIQPFIDRSSVIRDIEELVLSEPSLHNTSCNRPGYYIEKCLSALAKKIRKIVVFGVRGVNSMSDSVLRLYFSKMEHVKYLFLKDCLGNSNFSEYHIDKLRKSKHLKVMQIDNLRVPCVYEAKQIEKCIIDLQSHQPQLKVNFNIIVVERSERNEIHHNVGQSNTRPSNPPFFGGSIVPFSDLDFLLLVLIY